MNLSKIGFGATGMRRLFNIWPPFLAAGIRVREISADFRSVTVELRAKLLNRNWVGTHFGGSLFSMTDPFYMIMMMQNLGREYIVWDKQASVRFLKPAKGTVTARFTLDPAEVDRAREATAAGDKYEPRFRVELVDAEGVVVADVEKTLYIRKKKPSVVPA